MISRKWIGDLVEPRKEGAFSTAYDFLMIVAIIMGTVPLLFRVQIKLFWYFDIISGAIYLVDYLLRWMTCDLRSDKPKWKAFLLYPFTPMAILDLLSILPTFNLLAPTYKLTKAMRLLKIVRFTRIVHYIGPLDIFVSVIKKQWKLLMAVLLVAFFVILITAIIIFQSEKEIDPVTGEYIFKNFYDAFYWAAITLTTVGFGDLYPVSNLGKTLSIISSLFGIATIALPSSIITAGYMQELNRRVKTEKGEGEGEAETYTENQNASYKP
ncbi:MAG: ion transporter [Bacteroidales bacterium]|nr:ion transporter [Bacteroidales bacterium]